MAAVTLNRTLAATARTLSVCLALYSSSLACQQMEGSLTGRLTDLHSAPLGGISITLRNQDTGAEIHTTTAHHGVFHAIQLAPGLYTVTAESDALGHGFLSGILVQPGREARIQAAMHFEPRPPEPLVVADYCADHFIPLEPAVIAFHWPLLRMALLPTLPISTPALPYAPPVTESVSMNTALHATLHPLANLADLPLIAAAPLQPARRHSFAVEEPSPLASISTVTLTGAELQQLPVRGRRWEEFAEAAPGIIPAAGADRAQMRGQSQDESDTAIDGMSTRLAFGSPSTQSRTTDGQEAAGNALAGGRGMGVSEAAVSRLEASSGNAEADADRATSGRTQVTTQHGSNGLHGQAFVFSRSNLWNARNPFTKWTRETASGTSTTLPTFTSEPYSPEDREILFGFGIGRQIRKDKLFLFAALDGLQRNHPGVAMLKHPDLFFAQPSNDRMQLLGAQLGAGSLAIPSYSKLLESLSSLLGPAPRTTAQWSGFARVDWNPHERHHVTVEGNVLHWDSPGGGFRRVNETYGNHSFGSSQADSQWLLGRWETFLSSDLLLLTQLSWNRTILSAHAQQPSAFEKTFKVTAWDQLPQIVVDSRDGLTIGNPARFGAGSYPDENTLRLQQALSWAHGDLMLRGGFQFDHTVDRTSLVRNQTGTYHYSNLENFATDALVFAAYGIAGSLNKFDQHNCDQTGRAWRDSAGVLRGLGYLPCYSYYTQTMGPSAWFASTNEAAFYLTAQWQPVKYAVLSAGLRWEREQLPEPIAEVNNAALPLTQQTPALGNNWGPRISLALGNRGTLWPVLRMGYGIYYGRVLNSTLLTVLSHTGSFNGDLSFYLRPTDNLNQGGAPPFPYVFTGEPLSVVKPGAVQFSPTFRNPEVHQALIGVEKKLPWSVRLTATAMLSLGRRLPITVDTNINPAVNPGTITYAVVDDSGKGPIKAPLITLPFYANWSASGVSGRLNTGYQQVVQVESRANSTYEAATVRLDRFAQRGLGFHARYTYAHATDWNPNESLRLTGGSVLDPDNFSLEYGTSNLDVRHIATLHAVYLTPWKFSVWKGRLLNNWALAGIGHYRSGMPYSMRTGGALPKFFTGSSGTAVVALGSSINGSGGDNRIYGLGSDGIHYNLGRNTYRYPGTWKADLRLTKRVNLTARRQLELMIESFNLFNHQNVTGVETMGYSMESGTINGGRPQLNFRSGLQAGSIAFGQPLNVNATNYYRERQIEFGVRMRF